MKKPLAYILSFIICALSLTACTEEAVISAGAGGTDAGQNELQPPYSSEVAVIYAPDGTAAETTEPKPEPQQSVEEWKEWECIAERPYEYEENTVTTVSAPQPAAENNDPVPVSNTSDDPVNTTPAYLNAPLPTMTFKRLNAAGEYEYTIQNNTEYEWGYGLEPFFDKYDEEQGVWLPVAPKTEITVIAIYCILQPGGSSSYSLPIESYYGVLSAGSYRIGLLMRNHVAETAEMVWYEFGIDVIECY